MYRLLLHSFTFLVFIARSLPAQENVITIDASVEYQTIDNFGASDCWSFQKIGAWYTPQKERIADLLFSVDKGIGLSAWRFNIGAGINRTTINHNWRTVETFEIGQGQYDWSRQEEERWFLQAAKERGVDQFIAFVNSPPARMTLNGYTNCTNGLGSTNLKSSHISQYAAYLMDILKHFRDEWDIEFDFISPINEPQWEWNDGCNQEGNRASNEDIRAIVNALHDELQRQGVEIQISIVESGDLKSWYQESSSMEFEYGKNYGNYLTELIADDNINTKIGNHFCGHSYWSDLLNSQLIQNRQALLMKMLPYLTSGWKYWMTEYCVLVDPEGNSGRGRDLSIKTALDVARVIHYDLTILRASAWQWWTAVSPEDYKDGLIYTDYMNNPNSHTIIESKLLWALGNYSRFIRPGSVRVKLSGANNKYGLLGSAYLNENRSQLIVVLINMSTAEIPITLTINGVNSETSFVFTPSITSDSPGDDLKEDAQFSSDMPYNVPARSIVTLVSALDTSTSSNNYSPTDYKLFPNFPNPFNLATIFEYYLPEPGSVKISIYSVTGQQIKTLINEEQGEGFHRARWNGTDMYDMFVSSGVYVYTLKANRFVDAKKMVFLQ
ncbi:T9SS type A sorting domain-containing protein [candidate division KSB1 bacterium]|nr:T9SS type A sorting domain-containing protein [candidate division KSB1 bacterium]